VRDLGTRGVPVIVAYEQFTAPARWSRHAGSLVRCPPGWDGDRFVEWLHEFGERRPGCVLCPTSDNVAFLVATHRESLAPMFHLFSPSRDALVELIDKSRLLDAAARAGLSSPATWCPLDAAAVREIAYELPLPLLVKPRTTLLSRSPGKAERVDRPEDLVAAWRRVQWANRHQPQRTGVPLTDRPLIQRYHATAERIYTVDGFVDATGTIVGTAACMKLLQLPRRSGPGICFETADQDPAVFDGLQRLCRDTKFVGIFDAEFLVDGDRNLLIDFNPRFYGHMAFEIDRGLPLPWLIYLAALGDDGAVRDALTAAGVSDDCESTIYVARFATLMALMSQRLAGHLTWAELRRWRQWMVHASARVTDPVYVRNDPLPAAADVVQWLRRPVSFVRKAAAP
jgi:D-aspartate ligase